MNLYLSCLTQPAPSANYRGESEQNRAVIQKITIGQQEFPVVSPEAIRNALREILIEYGLPSNRRREHNEDQLAVSFQDYPNPKEFVDDFYFGYMVANQSKIKDKVPEDFVYKRDSVLRNNLAVGTQPYRYETLFTQSPKTVVPGGGKDKPKWSNADSSQLLHREMTYTSYQYPMALNLKDCQIDPANPDDKHNVWFSSLLQGITELNGVAGNHARSLFDMSPVSVVARVTNRLASGFPLYPFSEDGSANDVIDLLSQGDQPGGGFHLGGEIVRNLDEQTRAKLEEVGVGLHRTPEALFDTLSRELCGRSLPCREAVS